MKATDFISAEIKAQKVCMTAVLEVTDHILPMYEKAIKDGLIDNIEVEMEVWNRGYQVTIKPIFDWVKVISESTGELACFQRFNVFIQPASFFNSEFSKGRAKIEAGVTFRPFDSVNEEQACVDTIAFDTTDLKSDIDKMFDR